MRYKLLRVDDKVLENTVHNLDIKCGKEWRIASMTAIDGGSTWLTPLRSWVLLLEADDA